MNATNVAALYVLIPAIALLVAPYLLTAASALAATVRLMRSTVTPQWSLYTPRVRLFALQVTYCVVLTVDASTRLVTAARRELQPNAYIRAQFCTLMLM